MKHRKLSICLNLIVIALLSCNSSVDTHNQQENFYFRLKSKIRICPPEWIKTNWVTIYCSNLKHSESVAFCNDSIIFSHGFPGKVYSVITRNNIDSIIAQTATDTSYNLVCQQDSVTYDYFFQIHCINQTEKEYTMNFVQKENGIIIREFLYGPGFVSYK